MASENTKLMKAAKSYNWMVGLTHILNDDVKPDARKILRVAMVRGAYPAEAHGIEGFIRSMRGAKDSHTVADKVQTLWVAALDEDAEAFTESGFSTYYDQDFDRYYVRPMQRFVQDMSQDNQDTLEDMLAAHAKGVISRERCQAALNDLFRPVPETRPEGTPGHAAAPDDRPEAA